MAMTAAVVAPERGDEARLRAVAEILDELRGDGPAPVVMLSGERSSRAARARRGRPPRLWVSREAIDVGGSALRGEVAHEYAHVVDGAHVRDTILKVAGWMVLAVGAVSGTMAYPSLAPATAPPLTVLAVWLGGSLAWGCAGCWVRSRNHRIELRADRAAAELLGSVDPVLAMHERLHDVRAGHKRRRRIQAWFTHPTPSRRRRALTAG